MDNSDSLEIKLTECTKNRLIALIENKFKVDSYTFTIDKVINKETIHSGLVFRVKVTPVGLKPESVHFIVKRDKVLSVIVKVPPKHLIPILEPCFIRESLLYEEVLPLFRRFQESRGIAVRERGFSESPNCYEGLRDDDSVAIFLEDLEVQGFRVLCKHEQPTIKHIELVMRALGKLHAVSIAMKDQCPEKFRKYKSLRDVYFQFEEEESFKNYLDAVFEKCVGVLDPTNDSILLDKIKSFFNNRSGIQILKDLRQIDSEDPYSVLCHGDCWNANVLFRYRWDGTPFEVQLIDWKLSCYASPVIDVVSFLFSCASQEFRRDHYEYALETYYASICNLLKSLGSDPEKVFPRLALEDSLRKYGALGFVSAAMLGLDMAQSSERVDGAQNEMYSQRIKSVIEDVVEYGYL